MEELCPNCFEDIEESGKCSQCDELFCKGCSQGEDMTCPHCGSSNAWKKF